MHLIDTHTHLESFARKGVLDAALERARAAGVGEMITIGTEPADWKLYRDLAAAHGTFVRYTVGLHPCSVNAEWQDAVGRVEAYWNDQSHPKPVALGEIGLDRFHLPKDDVAAAEQIFSWQKQAFTAALQIAKRLAVPVVIHSRGAFSECVQMIDQSGVDWQKVVFHCFTEGEAEMRQLMERGGFGSFTGILTYKSADIIRAAARLQGVDRFMLETDAPYLTPMPHRGKPNEPAFVRHTAEFAAELFGVTLDELAATSMATARSFFRLV
jgi:TatD DNase family protein